MDKIVMKENLKQLREMDENAMERDVNGNAVEMNEVCWKCGGNRWKCD